MVLWCRTPISTFIQFYLRDKEYNTTYAYQYWQCNFDVFSFLHSDFLSRRTSSLYYILNRMYARSSNELLPFVNAFVALKV